MLQASLVPLAVGKAIYIQYMTFNIEPSLLSMWELESSPKVVPNLQALQNTGICKGSNDHALRFQHQSISKPRCMDLHHVASTSVINSRRFRQGPVRRLRSKARQGRAGEDQEHVAHPQGQLVELHLFRSDPQRTCSSLWRCPGGEFRMSRNCGAW